MYSKELMSSSWDSLSLNSSENIAFSLQLSVETWTDIGTGLPHFDFKTIKLIKLYDTMHVKEIV